ncbi:MAG TPA: nucleotidyl transferase AbiEii/AbiGii toxin family protein [Candidatus Tumulicola sp.]
MDQFARLLASERREIIAEVATNMSVDFTIIEKDFWVCWTLQSLFSLPPGHAPMVFKGGTSLSKAYGLIERFSEDVDVVTSVDFYLSRGAADPEEAPSRTQQLSRMQALDSLCARYIAEDLANVLRQRFEDRLATRTGWEITVDPDDRYRHTLLFRYPTSAPDVEHTYIRGRVKIELGWRSVTEPRELRTFTSYVATRFPDLMEDADVTCTVLLPKRTFWEKVTALHAESFRDGVPHFFSRHYSDVASMRATEIGEAASRDLAALEDVRQYKERYYPAAWARYDLAVPGSLSIVPSDTKMRALASDYRDMQMMFLREPAPFDDMIQQLRSLQDQINTN